MIENTVSVRTARRIYDRWGARYDWFTFVEGRAKARAIKQLHLAPGLRVLNVGVGTGREQAQIEAGIAPHGVAIGLDLSRGMLRVAHTRVRGPLCEADGHDLPFAAACFDRLLCAYTLDLIPYADIPRWLAGFHRVLKPGGRLVLLTMTEGVTLTSKVFVALWKFAYAISPVVCSGCRPLQLSGLAQQAGFESVACEVIVQFGVPSELIAARC